MKKSCLLVLILFSFITVCGQHFGNAINFDGINDGGIVAHHASLNPGSGSWSVVCWLKASNENQVSPIVMKRNTQAPYIQYSYGFAKDDPHNPVAGKRIRINHIEENGITERSGYTKNEYINGNWHHYAIIADKKQDGIVVYVDGIAVEFIQLYYYGIWPDVQNSVDLIIGKRSPGERIKGPMDELSIWNKALNRDQVLKIMSDTLVPKYYSSADSGLVAYYRFEKFENLGIKDSDIDDIRDLSFYKNHMDTEGTPELIPSFPTFICDRSPVYQDITIFPNPASGQFTVKDLSPDIKSIELIDMTGKIIKVFYNRITEHELMVFNINGLPSGIYFARFYAANRMLTKVLIKE